MIDAAAQLNTELKDRYEILQEIGAGGMATVYLARDLKHNRKVALKVLRPDLGVVLGAERFLSEIEVTANLQHPNLLPLFDSGEAAGYLFYVMPFVDGESLRARLTREKQLPIDEALHIATSVASALDYAHRHGVIHRDLKPENILLHEGQPLVADFGIALAVSNAGGGRITQTGLSLGTPQYMSPEQATGDRVINARTDIYSLGAVTYEMLTGDAPHVGSNSQAIIARVLTETPRPIRVTRPNVPEHVEAAVTRALEKLPADRFATAHEFADAVSGKVVVLLPSVASTAVRGATVPATPSWRAALHQPLTRVLAALVVVTAAAALLQWRAARRTDAGAAVRFLLTFEDSTRWSDATGSPFAMSPDGRLLAFVGTRAGGAPRLFVRGIDDLRARELAGTERAFAPFFSPDGKWIGFYTGTHLRKIPVEGGTPIVLGEVPAMLGASWPTPDQIVVATQGDIGVITANGGSVRIVAKKPSDGSSYRWPLALPDGKTVVVTSWRNNLAGARLAVVTLPDGRAHPLDIAGTAPLAVLHDHVVYATAGGAISVTRWNGRTLAAEGTPIPVVDDATVGPGGPLKGAVSTSGSLIYVRGGVGGAIQMLVAGPHSVARPFLPELRLYAFPRFSPDGKHLAFAVSTDRTDIFIYDLPSGPLRRLTAAGTLNDRPEWTPDSRQVLFRSNRGGTNALYVQPADGNREAEVFFKYPSSAVDEGALSLNGANLFVQLDTTHGNTGGQAFYRGMRGDTTIKLIAGSDRGQQVHARPSPDARWVAYSSSELGTWEVYVKPFPSLDARYQVSLRGGSQPMWSRDGSRLYYIDQDGRLLSATIGGKPFAIVARDTLLTDVVDTPPGVAGTTFFHPNYDVTPDGKSFVFLRGVVSQASVIVVHDWKHELAARLGRPDRR